MGGCEREERSEGSEEEAGWRHLAGQLQSGPSEAPTRTRPPKVSGPLEYLTCSHT